MSEENVEAVRQGYAGFAENGVEGVITSIASADRSPRSAPTTRPANASQPTVRP